MWALFLLEHDGPKRFAWLGGSSLLMKEAQGNVKSQKNIFRTLPGLPKVMDADCSRVNGGSTQEEKTCMVRTWLAATPTIGDTFCRGSAQDGAGKDGAGSMVETWLASKPTTGNTFYGGSAQDKAGTEGAGGMLETWLASKPTTWTIFRSESLPCQATHGHNLCQLHLLKST